MKYRIHIILLVVSIFYSCEDDYKVKEALNLYQSSSIQVEKKANVIDSQTTNQYSFIKGNNTVLEYAKDYDEKNSIDEEYWSKLLIEFNENDIDYDDEYLPHIDKVNLYLQSGSFDGLMDYEIESGGFSIKKSIDSFTLTVFNDIIGTHNKIKLVFIKKGDYQFYN